MAKGKFTRYAEAFGGEVGLFFNRGIATTLRTGIQVAVMATKQDSSLAAYHWMVVPKGGQFRPGNRRISKFQYVRGRPPVGEKGDKGKNREAVKKHVTNRELEKVIRRAVKAKVPVYAFYNDTPQFTDDVDPDDASASSYRSNAKIDQAMKQAYSEMNDKFKAYIARGNIRKNPFSGTQAFPTNF